MQNELGIVIILVIGWSRRLVVRTPGFHPGNRGFDSHRDHHFLLLVFLFGGYFLGGFQGILGQCVGLPITGEIC